MVLPTALNAQVISCQTKSGKSVAYAGNLISSIATTYVKHAQCIARQSKEALELTVVFAWWVTVSEVVIYNADRVWRMSTRIQLVIALVSNAPLERSHLKGVTVSLIVYVVRGMRRFQMGFNVWRVKKEHGSQFPV
jgi:hypothetical protein